MDRALLRKASHGSISRLRPHDRRLLAALPAAERAALSRLRKVIRAAAPKAEECIRYRVPTIRLHGMLISFAAAAKHCALDPLNSTTVKEFADELREFETSRGTIRFQTAKPLPVESQSDPYRAAWDKVNPDEHDAARA